MLLPTQALNGSQLLLRKRPERPLTRWVSFELCGQRYALDILCVREVLMDAAIEPVPGAPSQVLGVINLRGRIVTMIDLHDKLGLDCATTLPVCAIVVEMDGEPLALRVDRIAELCAVPEDAIAMPPRSSPNGDDGLVVGLVNRGGAMLTLLSAKTLLRF